MRTSRIYLPLNPEQVVNDITITGEKAHYIRNVLRCKLQQPLNFFIPSGVEYQGTIVEIKKHTVLLSDINALAIQPQTSALQTTLVQGISSSDRMDYSVQKAAELGCHTLIPVLTDFCSQKVPAHKQNKKQAHWQAVAISASEQSGRAEVMQVAEIQSIQAVIENTPKALYLEPNARLHLNQIPRELQQQQTIFIGPEGGFSPTELEAFNAAAYLGVQLGQRVLRTETVAPVILAALHTLYGDFMPQTE